MKAPKAYRSTKIRRIIKEEVMLEATANSSTDTLLLFVVNSRATSKTAVERSKIVIVLQIMAVDRHILIDMYEWTIVSHQGDNLSIADRLGDFTTTCTQTEHIKSNSPWSRGYTFG